MPEYINPNNYTVHLVGPDGKVVLIKGHKKVVLSEYFERYVPRGFIKRINTETHQAAQQRDVTARIQLTRKLQIQKKVSIPSNIVKGEDKQNKREETARARKLAMAKRAAQARTALIKNVATKKVIGRSLNIDPTELLKANLNMSNYPVSNNIGIGILSFNRGKCLQRLIDSIVKFTDLRRTTVFISDDGSDDLSTKEYLKTLSENINFVTIMNDARLGVAGNSNRLLRCLSRFAYGILLNDDVEILSQGWEHFYADAMQHTNMHHFIYREPGVYRAGEGETTTVNNVFLKKVIEKPHGAVLAFDHHMLQNVGYFDEAYGYYGMEHVDWSQKTWETGLQSSGFYDVIGSDRYFKLHADVSVVPNRQQLLHEAKKVFLSRVTKHCEPSVATKVPEITYVIPFRNFERTESICTIVNNIRAQRYPVVHIVVVEQDEKSHIDIAIYNPVIYLSISSKADPLFNKSMAFNLGVSKAPSDCVFLHDADILALGRYTSSVMTVLKVYQSCHLGKTVIYTTRESMGQINATGLVNDQTKCERVVGYYEGGSIACTTKAYWQVGGFNEDYKGYGCEDCDFYARLSGGSLWKEDRIFDFVHLWHSRVPGWNIHHENNKELEKKLQLRSVQERIELQKEQLRRIGYGEFVKDVM